MANTKVLSWTSSAIVRDGMEIFAKSDIVARGQRDNRLIAARHAGFLTEHDLYADPDAERRADPYYSEIASETLAIMGLPTLVLDEKGKVLATNHLIEALTSYIHWRAQDRVSLTDRAADQLLRNAIAAIDVAGGSSGISPFTFKGCVSVSIEAGRAPRSAYKMLPRYGHVLPFPIATAACNAILVPLDERWPT